MGVRGNKTPTPGGGLANVNYITHSVSAQANSDRLTLKNKSYDFFAPCCQDAKQQTHTDFQVWVSVGA